MSSKWFLMELPDLITDGHTFKSAIDSFQFNDTSAQHGSAGGNGKLKIRRVDITRTQDKYSPLFSNISMNGKAFEEMTLTVLTFDNGSMISRVFYNFSNVILEQYVPQSGSFRKGPTERLTFDFTNMGIGT